MTSEVITVRGKAEYARLWEGNMDKGSSVADGDMYDYPPACMLNLIMSQEEASKLTTANPKVKLQVKEEGLSARFKRVFENEHSPNKGGAPIVKDAEGDLWDTNVLIGNGSDVTVAAEVYDTRFGKGMRLMGVQVHELVPYEGQEEPELPF